jgi:adenylate cyclase
MDRIWQWAWDRYGTRYSWAIWVVAFAVLLPTYLVYTLVVVAFEKSSHYVEVAVFIGLAVAIGGAHVGSSRRPTDPSCATVRDRP